MYDFNYNAPKSTGEAISIVSGDEDAMYLAGGMTLLPTMKQRLRQPSQLVDLNGVADLAGVSETASGLTIGAMTRHADVAASAVVANVIPALAKLAGGIGDPQVRNRGTIGGSISNNDPAADYPGAVVGLGATVVTDKREIAGDDFFTGMFSTALEPGELVTAVKFPKAERAAYAKFPNPASRYAMVGVFVAKTGGGVRVAVTGAGPCVFRWAEAEAALSANFSVDAVKALKLPADDLNSDMHGSADYRAHLVGVMLARAVASA
jgi:aerobic carbon-monoxide dehydrogenase medium subunit